MKKSAGVLEGIEGTPDVDIAAGAGLLDNDRQAPVHTHRVVVGPLEDFPDAVGMLSYQVHLAEVHFAQALGGGNPHRRYFHWLEAHDIGADGIDGNGVLSGDDEIHLHRGTGMGALAFHTDYGIDYGKISLPNPVHIGKFLSQIDPVGTLLLVTGMPVGNNPVPVL
jgi:hypothetical protein